MINKKNIKVAAFYLAAAIIIAAVIWPEEAFKILSYAREVMTSLFSKSIEEEVTNAEPERD